MGSWTYIVSVSRIDALNPGLPHSFRTFLVATAKVIGFTTILTVPFGAVLGAVDAAARRSSRPLVQVPLLVVDALLIVLFALAWIVPVALFIISLNYGSCDTYDYCQPPLPPIWPEFIGGLIGGELGLVVLLVVSVTDPWRRRRRQ